MEIVLRDSFLEFKQNVTEELYKLYKLDNGRLEESIDILEKWIAKQSHFIRKDFDRNYLVRVLVTRKGSIERTKLQLDQICTMKTLLPKFFIDGNVRKTFQSLLEKSTIIPLPKVLDNHKRLMLSKMHAKVLNVEDMVNYFRFHVVVAEYLSLYDLNDGTVVILDYRDIDLTSMLRVMNPVDLQQLLTIMIKGYGARLLAIHIFSHSRAIDVFVKIVKSVVKKKLADRIHVHQNNEALESHLEKDVLPMEYGGTDKSIYEIKEKFLDELCTDEFEKYLAKRREMCTNEALRPLENRNDDFLGLAGSFRTLSVD